MGLGRDTVLGKKVVGCTIGWRKGDELGRWIPELEASDGTDRSVDTGLRAVEGTLRN